MGGVNRLLINNMRIPLIYIPKTRWKIYLYIQKRYKSKNIIIPIGCDCHPTHTLSQLLLRNCSYPFDWLSIQPIRCFDYLNNNLEDKFDLFLKGIQKNERGYYIAEKYPYSEFMHEKSLREPKSINKFNRRINRFTQAFNDKKIIFLHNIPVIAIKSRDDVTSYIQGVKTFQNLLRNNSSLHSYLRFDEHSNENNQYADQLFLELEKLNVNVYRYVRELKKYGIWGDKTRYKKLYDGLQIRIKPGFPKIYVK